MAQQDKTARPVEWARRLTYVRGFARYWSAHDSQTEIPPCGLLPHRPGRAHPYLYRNDEICKLLQAARRLPSGNGLRGPTYYCLLGLLTVTGLRISEARNLKTEDVDLQKGLLTIRGTKFGKSRLVPIHPSTRAVLTDYASRRDRFLARLPDTFFVSGRVDYTIGSKWQKTYATRLPNGEVQVMPLQYNREQKRWSAFWKAIDSPGSERAQVTNFPNLSRDTAYLVHCGPCHTSQLRVKTKNSPEPKDLVIPEGGINCEMCHGPGGDHVASMRSAKPGDKPPLKLQVEFGKISSRDYVAICGQCHLQSSVLTLGPEGEINYRHSPGTFYVHYRSVLYGEFALRNFYRDGRFRVISFAVESFLRSKCYQKGQANCGHCHDFHPSESGNVRALKFLDNPNQMCLQCHSQYAAKLEEHTHHAVNSEGSRCTACHMPKIMTTVGFKTMTHTIDDIPNAEMTARYGQENSPKACLICHTDKSISWLKQELGNWNQRDGSTVATTSSAR